MTGLILNGEQGASVRGKINDLLTSGWSNAKTVDVNKVYGVVPGDDVTTILQTLLNTLTTGVSLDIVFSVTGTYYVNGAQQTGTALGYSYSGAVLIPAVAWDNLAATPLRIRGSGHVAFGDPSTGAPSGGVTLATTDNTPGGYMFAAVPQYSKWGGVWTGVVPHFENIIFKHPANPQGGSVNVECCIKAFFINGVCDQGALNTANFPTGTTEAIRLPATKNNGNVVVRNWQVRGWGYGIRLSEHNVLDNVDLSYCAAAFTFVAGGHANWFGYVDVEECKCVFKVLGSSAVLIISGALDIENIATGTSFAPTLFAEFVGSGAGVLGQLDITLNPSGSLGLKGAGTVKVDFTNLVDARKRSHPVDTMARLQSGVALPAGEAPGLTWPSLDAWRVLSGSFALSAAGELTNANAGSSSAYLPVRDGFVGGQSRCVKATVTLPASSYNWSLFAHKQQNGSGIWAQLESGNLVVGIGTNPGNGTITTISGAVSGGNTYTLAIDVLVKDGLLVGFEVLLNGVSRYQHACSSAQQYTGSGNEPYLYDGVYVIDNGSNVTKLTAFQVLPLTPSPAALSSGSATLVAGTVSIALPNITANSIVRLSRQAAGGTLGQLSVALAAGTGFAINSSSASETSTVYWEVVKI